MKKAILCLSVLLAFSLGYSQDWQEVIKISSSDNHLSDGFGNSISLDGNIAIIGARSQYFNSVGADSILNAGAAYIFSKDQNGNNRWGQVKKLIPSEREEYALFGQSVAIDSNYAIAGAHQENNVGAVYLFSKNSGGVNNWGQINKLFASDQGVSTEFGYRVSISGDFAVVNGRKSSKNQIYIFYRTNDWNELKIITQDDIDPDAQFWGERISISGDRLLVSAHQADYDADGNNFINLAGAAYVLYKDQGGQNNWGAVTKIVANDRGEEDLFGLSVNIDGNFAIVGTPQDDKDENGINLILSAGSAYIFYKDQGGTDNWGQVKKLVASDREEDDRFGITVDISGDYAIVGAYGEDHNEAGIDSLDWAGSSYIFYRNQGGLNNWGQVAKIVASDRSSDAHFGASVSISGETTLVTSGPYGILGSGYLFKRSSTETFFDPRDGHEYKLVNIGNQTWMAENLNYYTPSGSWYYDDDSVTYADTLGRLYDWDTAFGACPTNWKLPSDDDWKVLEKELGMSDVELENIGARGTDEGTQIKIGGISGFDAIFAGEFKDPGAGFVDFGSGTGFWTSTDISSNAFYRYIASAPYIYRNNDYLKTNGISVRCLKEIDTLKISLQGFNTSSLYGNDGGIDASVSGGIEPYKYLWSSGDTTEDLSNIFTGSYSITVTDARDSSIVDSVRIYQTFIDERDGQVYKAVTIGDQIWMAENLNAIKYSDGTAIPLVEDASAWDALGITDKTYCFYDNSSSNGETYGALYTWAAAMNGEVSSIANPSGVQGVCPTGWHLPSDAEWTQLTDYLGGESVAGGKLKETDTTHWESPNIGATNETGFTALPGGYRNYDGPFYFIGGLGNWWSSAKDGASNAWYRSMAYNNSNVYRDTYFKELGYSVRCVEGAALSKPSITTNSISDITSTSATVGGEVTDNGGDAVTDKGVYYSTSADAETTGTKLAIGSGTGIFSTSLIGLTECTLYYIKAYATNSVGTSYGVESTFTTLTTPTLTTTAISAVTNISAESGGNITDNGGTPVTARGVCWSTTSNPTIAGNLTSDATGTGTYISSLTLTSNTTYYVRAYATNSEGTAYGNEVILKTMTGTVADYDGNTYYTVTIGSHVWMAENLRANKYTDGTSIPLIENITAWDNLGYVDKAFSYYENITANGDTFGALYTWAAAMNGLASSDANPSGVQGICPKGWHLPSDAEWKELEMDLGMSQSDADGTDWRGTDEGGKMKETGTTHWLTPNTGATNLSGFTALPGGYRYDDGSFYNMGSSAFFWSSTELNSYYAWLRELRCNYSEVRRYGGDYKDYGFSVRCVRDTSQCQIESIQFNGSNVNCYGETNGSIITSIIGSGSFTFSWETGQQTKDLSGLAPGWYTVTVTDTLNFSLTDSIEILEPQLLIAGISDSTNISSPGLSDGSATVTPSGGIPGYAYLWDDDLITTDSTVAGLSANKWYHVTVSDANLCSTMDSVMLSEPGVLQAVITDSTNVSCNGLSDGSATVTVLGGTPPISILWNDDAGSTTSEATNLFPNRWYTVTITDASMQTVKDSVYISEPAAINVTKVFSEVSCSGMSDGFIDLSISGGSLPLSYSWSNGETTEDILDITPGEYSVIITDDNSCIKHDTTSIDSVTTYQDQEICMVTVSLDNKNLIVWERPVVSTIEKFNIYRHTVEFDYQKIGSVPYDSLSIYLDASSLPSEISHFYKISITDKCGNESELSEHHKTMHLTSNMGTSGEVNLIWENYEGFPFVLYNLFRGSTPDQLSQIRSLPNNVTSFTDNNHPAGLLYYQTSIEKPEPCFPSSSKKAGTGPYTHSLSNMDDNKLRTGFEQLISTEGLLIYPNPAMDRVIIQFANPEHQEYQLRLTDLTGKVLRIMDNITEDHLEIIRGGLPSGLYLIELRGTKIYRGKIVIE